MMNFKTMAELADIAEKADCTIGDIVLRWEAQKSERTEQLVTEDMAARLVVMKQAVSDGISKREKSFSGLVGEDSFLLARSQLLLGPVPGMAAAYALAVSEVNARMGKIVACPTAGSCGILPGAILAVGDYLNCQDDVLIRALCTAAGVGKIIADNATISGAVGGCQAECGSAAAMAAAAVVEIMGGSPRQSAEALALALKNMLGLVCDPVAGLVEVPCVKRNAFAAVHSIVAAQMALAGIRSVIPADEVIDAMLRIGQKLPGELKETSDGGLAATPTARSITDRLMSAE